MLTQTKVGLASSAVALVSSVTAFVVDTAAVMSTHSVGQTAIQIAAVSVITAIGSIVAPIALAWIKAWSDQEKARLESENRDKDNDFETRIALLTEKAARVEGLEKESQHAKEIAWQAKLEAEKYKTRLELLESRALKNSQTLDEVKGVVNSTVVGVGSLMSPVVGIVTDAYGKVLSVSGQSEFVLHYSAGELIGKNIEELIPMKLHPDPIHHQDRSFDPSMEFHDKFFRAIPALTKQGKTIDVDVVLTRWFEKGLKGKVEGVRFGKIIRKHVPGLPESGVPFPSAASVLPGFVTPESSDQIEALNINTEAIRDVNATLKQINPDAPADGMKDAHS